MRSGVTFSVVLLLLAGCHSRGSQNPLVGRWECTDLSAVEHVSQFAKYTLIFRPDGTCEDFLTDDDGSEQPHDQGSYKSVGDRVFFDQGDFFGGQGDSYRFAVAGDQLTLRVESAQNKEDIGLTLIFRRSPR